jgi:uncharacterized protein involved in response to NO
MTLVRTLIRRHRAVAMLLVALALCLRALVPQGYMLAADGPMHLTVQLCNGEVGHDSVRIAVPRTGGHHDGQPDKRETIAPPCAFTSLFAAALTGPVGDWAVREQPAARQRALLFSRRFLLRRGEHLQPPAQAPPGTFLTA